MKLILGLFAFGYAFLLRLRQGPYTLENSRSAALREILTKANYKPSHKYGKRKER